MSVAYLYAQDVYTTGLRAQVNIGSSAARCALKDQLALPVDKRQFGRITR
jgi:hypothetical protein